MSLVGWWLLHWPFLLFDGGYRLEAKGCASVGMRLMSVDDGSNEL